MSCLLTTNIFGCVDFAVAGIQRLLIANRSLLTKVYYNTNENEFSTVASISPTTTTWYEFNVNSVATSAEDKLNISLFGKSFTHTFKTTIIGLDYEKRTTIKQLIDSDNLIIVFQDNNDKWWVLGEDKAMRVVEYSSKTGQGVDDNNLYNITIENTTKYKMRAINSTFVNNYILNTTEIIIPPACDCDTLLAGTLNDVAACALSTLASCPLQ